MPRSLVTGGAGFLGSHLCERLLGAGHEVICLDNWLTGTPGNVAHLSARPGFTMVEGDIRHPPEIRGDLDYVFHLASLASPKDYVRHPIATLEVGSIGTQHALELARQSGGTFLLASTSEIYGDPAVHPQVESYWGNVNPIGPRSMYDESKRFSEALTVAYHSMHGTTVRIARIFNSYGSRMRPGDGRVIPAFMTQALQNHPLTVYGTGQQTRSLCFVDDMVDGLFRLATLPGLEERLGGPPVVNLGNPREITMLALAHLIIQLTGSGSSITHEPLPGDDPQRRCPNIERARACLGWEPRVPHEEGLRRVIPYFRGTLMANSR